MTTRKRIKLINCDESILMSIIKGNKSLADKLLVNVPEKWTEFGEEIFRFSLNEIIKNPKSKKWWVYLPIDMETNTLIGSCGFKGEPNQGKVEIGYEVSEPYRNKGYATEMVFILINLAFKERDVKTIIAQTTTNNLPSIKVLKKCDFSFVQEFNDLEEGQIYEWIKTR